jgi:hypothetical protein
MVLVGRLRRIRELLPQNYKAGGTSLTQFIILEFWTTFFPSVSSNKALLNTEQDGIGRALTLNLQTNEVITRSNGNVSYMG